MAESSPPRILVADDREQNRYVLCRLLSAAGFTCVEAETGAGALEIAQTLPDVIILDVRLPDISGYEVCRTIKQDPRTASVSILQISASFVSSEDRVRALDAGADGYLTFPIDRLVLVATVQSHLRLRAAEAAARKSAADAVREAEKLAAMVKLANTIAHQVNNSLEALTNLNYLASLSDSPDETRKLLSKANEELERITRFTRQALSFDSERG